jgi:DNA-directed RNA polymerase
VSLEARVEWVLDNEEEICSIAENPYDNRGWCGTIGSVEIDKPWQFLAFCFEWSGYCKYGESFVSKLPVAMDGSCSGIQHFSAMLRDEIGGNAVNLVPAELPQDVYGMVAKKVIEQAQEEAVSGTEDELKHTEEGVAYVKRGTKALAKQWLSFGITRKTTKRSVMTLAYGSKEYGFKEQLIGHHSPSQVQWQGVSLRWGWLPSCSVHGEGYLGCCEQGTGEGWRGNALATDCCLSGCEGRTTGSLDNPCWIPCDAGLC